MAPVVPHDIATEILYYVPVKSAGRFRCVSKEWNTLLSSPHFIKIHQHKHNRNHIIFIGHGDLSLNSLPLVDFEEKTVLTPTNIDVNSRYVKKACIHGSCNGLVLVSTLNSQKNHSIFVLLNPTTREFTEISMPDYSYKVTYNIKKRLIMVGFGYDSVTDDYKILYNYLYSLDCMYVYAYSLRSGTWKHVDSCYNYSFDKMVFGDTLHGVFVDGFIHCFAKRRSDGLRVILGFSLADEKFNEVASPDDVDIGEDGCILADLGGKLAIFLTSDCEVWLMNEYGVQESWNKTFIQGLYGYRILLFEPMIYKTGEILIVANSSRELFIYDTEGRGSLKKIKIDSKNYMANLRSYVESLVSPKLFKNN
ncbi:F-box/kelch-repeat protein At3g06240-like [Rutidosis leptorrhynchoides]|uniref:F-box/kelch-repeat protein At3g06240-like n=1 Tax=Rutidosis leptorrhynchoides TaxID=125765 RepID=UPI003A99A7ED